MELNENLNLERLASEYSNADRQYWQKQFDENYQAGYDSIAIKGAKNGLQPDEIESLQVDYMNQIYDLKLDLEQKEALRDLDLVMFCMDVLDVAQEIIVVPVLERYLDAALAKRKFSRRDLMGVLRHIKKLSAANQQIDSWVIQAVFFKFAEHQKLKFIWKYAPRALKKQMRELFLANFDYDISEQIEKKYSFFKSVVKYRGRDHMKYLEVYNYGYTKFLNFILSNKFSSMRSSLFDFSWSYRRKQRHASTRREYIMPMFMKAGVLEKFVEYCGADNNFRNAYSGEYMKQFLALYEVFVTGIGKEELLKLLRVSKSIDQKVVSDILQNNMLLRAVEFLKAKPRMSDKELVVLFNKFETVDFLNDLYFITDVFPNLSKGDLIGGRRRFYKVYSREMREYFQNLLYILSVGFKKGLLGEGLLSFLDLHSDKTLNPIIFQKIRQGSTPYFKDQEGIYVNGVNRHIPLHLRAPDRGELGRDMTDNEEFVNIYALSRLGKVLVSRLQSRRLLKDEVTLLYPGSGEHMSLIETLMTLFKSNLKLNSAKLILTEVNDSRGAISNLLEALSKENSLIQDVGKWVNESVIDAGKGAFKSTLSFKLDTKEVVIEYYYKAFQSNADDWFGEENFLGSDVLFIHDLAGRESGRVTAALNLVRKYNVTKIISMPYDVFDNMMMKNNFKDLNINVLLSNPFEQYGCSCDSSPGGITADEGMIVFEVSSKR